MATLGRDTFSGLLACNFEQIDRRPQYREKAWRTAAVDDQSGRHAHAERSRIYLRDEGQGASEVAFKIGWAFDADARAREFNLASIPALGGLSCEKTLTHLWNTARSEFLMEQLLLRHFNKHRHPGNREVIIGVPYDQLEKSWIELVSKGSRSQVFGRSERIPRIAKPPPSEG